MTPNEAHAVQTWLAAQGYPFELHVGQVLRDADWDVEHAHWYSDPESGKAREIDLLAALGSEPPEVGPIATLELAVECKTSHDKPWVVFTAPSDPMDVEGLVPVTSDRLSHHALSAALKHEVDLPPILKPWSTPAHGIVRAHSDNKSGDPSAPFAAFRSAVTASREIGRENARRVMRFGADWGCAELVLPIVVLEGSLYRYYLLGDREPQLERITSVGLTVPLEAAARMCVVWLVTAEHWPQWVQLHTPEAKAFLNALAPHADEIVTSFLAKETHSTETATD